MKEKNGIKIDSILTGPLSVNTCFLSKGSECVVVDPANAGLVGEYLASHGLTCAAVLLTHGHFDHILAVAELQRGGARVYIGALDENCLYDTHYNLYTGHKPFDPCHADALLSDGEEFEEAGLRFRTVYTPGHTAGGVCYILDDARLILSGDTLFRGGVGRFDLIGGDANALYDSIKTKLFSLEGDYDVYPGHGSFTTLQYERTHNAYMLAGPQRW